MESKRLSKIKILPIRGVREALLFFVVALEKRAVLRLSPQTNCVFLRQFYSSSELARLVMSALSASARLKIIALSSGKR